jgi:hypothetical protein
MFFFAGAVQQGEASLQVLPPAPAPQGPATHQRQEPSGTQECASTTDATADTSRTDSYRGKLLKILSRTDSYRSKLLKILPGQIPTVVSYLRYFPDRFLP